MPGGQQNDVELVPPGNDAYQAKRDDGERQHSATPVQKMEGIGGLRGTSKMHYAFSQ